MQRREGNRGRRGALAAWVLLAVAPCVASGEDFSTNVRLGNSQQRFALGLALAGAARQFDDRECQAVLDDFRDAAGRPLRAALEESGLSASAYVGLVFFYDAPERVCGTSALAVTTPGSRVVFVCGSRLVRQMKRDSRHVEAALIHELLHSLGLGENPPSSDEITNRVRERCGERGKVGRGPHHRAAGRAGPKARPGTG